MLTECATVEEHKYAEIGPLLTVDRHHQEPSLVIAIVGACSSEDITSLNRWRTSQATGVALLLDAASWAVGAEATEKAARLTAADRRHRERTAPQRLAGRQSPAR